MLEMVHTRKASALGGIVMGDESWFLSHWSLKKCFLAIRTWLGVEEVMITVFFMSIMLSVYSNLC
jgi:hypothetical protein